jgi:SAM-dependent methyltransferase
MKNIFLTLIKKSHHSAVHTGRVEVISDLIAMNLPIDVVSMLDIGCGDGKISNLIQSKQGKVKIVGIDIMERPTCEIEYQSFDGENIPFAQNSFDAIQLVDVLHHTSNISSVISNALPISSKYLVIKDHLYQSRFDFLTLKFMDWVGNAPHGVKVIYNFQTLEQWKSIFKENRLELIYFNDKIKLYPKLVNWIFGRKLHFIAILKKNA